MLSKMGTSPSQHTSPHSLNVNEDLLHWLSSATVPVVVKDAVPVVADAMRHLMGKCKKTANLIEEIYIAIVGVSDRGDGEAIFNAIWTRSAC